MNIMIFLCIMYKKKKQLYLGKGPRKEKEIRITAFAKSI